MLVKCLGFLGWKIWFESCFHPKPHLVVIRIFSFLWISNDEPVPIVVYYSLSLEPYHLLISSIAHSDKEWIARLVSLPFALSIEYQYEGAWSYLTVDQFWFLVGCTIMCCAYCATPHLVKCCWFCFIQCMIIARTIGFGSKKYVSHGCLP